MLVIPFEMVEAVIETLWPGVDLRWLVLAQLPLFDETRERPTALEKRRSIAVRLTRIEHPYSASCRKDGLKPVPNVPQAASAGGGTIKNTDRLRGLLLQAGGEAKN